MICSCPPDSPKRGDVSGASESVEVGNTADEDVVSAGAEEMASIGSLGVAPSGVGRFKNVNPISTTAIKDTPMIVFLSILLGYAQKVERLPTEGKESLSEEGNYFVLRYATAARIKPIKMGLGFTTVLLYSG